MKGWNFASQVLSRHTFRISRKKGSDFFDHRGTLKLHEIETIERANEKTHPASKKVSTGQFKLASRCIPNLVVWFLKIIRGRKSQLVGRKSQFVVGRKSQLVVSYQVVTNPCCGLAVIFCGFISDLIVHGFTGKTVRGASNLQTSES